VSLLPVLALLLLGFHAPWVCIEPDGARHTAFPDHGCCGDSSDSSASPQAGLPDAEQTGGAADLGTAASAHDCSHASLDPMAHRASGSRAVSIVALPYVYPPDAVRETAAARIPASRPCATPADLDLAPTILRL